MSLHFKPSDSDPTDTNTGNPHPAFTPLTSPITPLAWSETQKYDLPFLSCLWLSVTHVLLSKTPPFMDSFGEQGIYPTLAYQIPAQVLILTVLSPLPTSANISHGYRTEIPLL